MARTTAVTPKGVAVYPRLDTPDTKFDAAGIFSTKLRLSSEDGEPIAAELTKQMEEALKVAIEENAKLPKAKQKHKSKFKLADPPFQVDDETGDYLFNFKMRHNVKSKDGKEYQFYPALFDSTGKPIDKNAKLRIGGGSIIRVSYEVGQFFTALVGAGVTLRLKGVQVIEFKEYTGGDNAGSFGFDAEEGGWVAPAAEAKTDADESADEGEEKETDGSTDEATDEGAASDF